MEIVGFLALLRRHWLLIVPGALFALFAGGFTLYQVSPSSPHLVQRGSTGGLAVGQTMLISTAAPTAELDQNRLDLAETLPRRAIMLANLMASDRLRNSIARHAGVEPEAVAVFGPAATQAIIPVPIAVEANEAARTPREPYQVFVESQNEPPLINVRATAPDPATAAKLVEGVRATIEKTLAAGVGEGPRITSTSLGPVRQGLVVDEPPKPLAVIATLVVFAMWCAGVIVVMGSLTRVRRSRADARAVSAGWT